MYHPHHHHKIKKKVRRILQKKEELSPSRPKDCDDLQSNDDCSINSTIYGVDCSRNQENSLITLLQQKQNMICEPKKSAKMPIMPIFSKWSLFFRGRVDKSRINRTRTRSCTEPSLDQRWPNRNKSLNFIVLVFLSVFTSLGQVQGKPQPPPLPPAGFIDFDNLPVTRFSCEGKVIGGYYADVETGCQMFHVCTLGQKDEVQDIKFLCLNGTVFDQETRVCERVDEVDCSKAEQYYDLNLDLYVPHVATPKPPEPDLEQEDDYIRPVSTHKPPPTTTTIRTTTTTRTTTPKATTTTPRPRMPSSQSSSNSKQNSDENSNKGFSSFNYYLKTPHSHVASGYNSESQQSYIFNHNPSSEEKDTSYTVSESTSGRKIPTGPKTIVYASSSARPRVPSTTTSTRAPVIIRPEEYEEQYADEYYDDEIPVDYDISSSTSSGSQQVGSNSKNYEVQQPNKNVYQQLQQYGRSKVPQNSYDYRDGRSTSDSKSDRGGRGPLSSSKGSETKSHVSVAFSSSKSTRSPPFILRTTPRPTPRPTTTTTARTTPRPLPKTTAEPEPYYYEDDYPDDTEIQEQERRPEPSVIVRMPNSISSTTLRTSSGKNLPPAGPSSKSNQQQISPTGPSSPSGPGDNAPEYYDDGEGDINPVNVNNHHFTHEDVPRIPFAKPNVPRVLVTNGKPFLPRLTRHIPHHNFSQDLLQHQKLRQKSPRPYRQSFWDTFLQEDYIRKKRNLQIHDEMKKV